MLENQFIKFTSLSLQDALKRPMLPITADPQDHEHDVFFMLSEGQEITHIIAQYLDGRIIDRVDVYEELQYIRLFCQDGYLSQLDTIGTGVQFVLEIEINQAFSKYSQPIVFVPGEGFSFLKYKCDEDAFGFPFHTLNDVYAQISLPINMYAPQFAQDDKTYVKANGEVVTLYAKYYKEWECETEYLSAEMHDKIVAALSCDEVYIDGKRVTKSDNYQVDWENYDLDCDGVTKLARATFKVRENTSQRNSNY